MTSTCASRAGGEKDCYIYSLQSSPHCSTPSLKEGQGITLLWKIPVQYGKEGLWNKAYSSPGLHLESLQPKRYQVAQGQLPQLVRAEAAPRLQLTQRLIQTPPPLSQVPSNTTLNQPHPSNISKHLSLAAPFPVSPIACALHGKTEGSANCWRSSWVPPANRLRLCSSRWKWQATRRARYSVSTEMIWVCHVIRTAAELLAQLL